MPNDPKKEFMHSNLFNKLIPVDRILHIKELNIKPRLFLNQRGYPIDHPIIPKLVETVLTLQNILSDILINCPSSLKLPEYIFYILNIVV